MIGHKWNNRRYSLGRQPPLFAQSQIHLHDKGSATRQLSPFAVNLTTHIRGGTKVLPR